MCFSFFLSPPGPDRLSLHWHFFHPSPLWKSHPHNTESLRNGSHWRPEEVCNSDSNHFGVKKGLNIKYLKIQTWSCMIACRVNSNFPLITYFKCCGWFTHPYVAPHWCRVSQVGFLPQMHCGRSPVEGLTAFWSWFKWVTCFSTCHTC